MTIADPKQASKALLSRIPADMLILSVLTLTATLAFGLGFLAGKDMAGEKGNNGFWIEELSQSEKKATTAAVVQAVPEKAPEPVAAAPEIRTYLASKNGSKYYLPTCGTAKRIKEENRVWFGTKAEAEAAGYTPAANCPGL